MNSLVLNKTLWLATSILSLIAAIIGVLNHAIYNNIIPPEFVAGAIPQDILTILVSLFMIILIPGIKEKDIVKQSIAVGIMGSLFYLYGIFVIERVYNLAYYLYLAIFSLSSWSIFYSFKNLRTDILGKIKLNNYVRVTNIFFSLFIAVLFTALWATALFPLVTSGNRVDFLYSIYILDLCFIMPGFIITAFLNFKNRAEAGITSIVMFILGFFVIFPLGLVELNKPSYGMETVWVSAIMSVVLSFAFLILAAANLVLWKRK